MGNNIDTTIAQTQLYNQNVLKGFVSTVAPLTAFATDFSPAAAERGYTVNVSFVPSGSAPFAVAGSTGYNTFNSTRELKSVSLDQHYAVGAQLSDREIANSTLIRLEDTAFNDGAELGTKVFQSVASVISGSNHPNGYNVSSSSLMTVDDLIAIRKIAGNNKMPMSSRNIVLNVNAIHGLLKDDDLKYIYKGSSETVSTGTIKDVFGFKNVWEVNGFPTGLVSGSNKQIGFAAVPDAVCVAMRTLTPPPEAAAAGVNYEVLTDAQTGISLGVRTWYDPTLGVTKRVYEALWGAAVGNRNGAINITATVDA